MSCDRRSVILGAAALAATGTIPAASTDHREATVTAPAERVLGIGGLFIRSRDPKKLTQWYQTHLGIDQPAWQQAAGPTAFSAFTLESEYFGSREQPWMINFRVRSLDAMVAQLQAAGIEVRVDPESSPYGRFARIHDPEGNPIELWEPPGGPA